MKRCYVHVTSPEASPLPFRSSTVGGSHLDAAGDSDYLRSRPGVHRSGLWWFTCKPEHDMGFIKRSCVSCHFYSFVYLLLRQISSQTSTSALCFVFRYGTATTKSSVSDLSGKRDICERASVRMVTATRALMASSFVADLSQYVCEHKVSGLLRCPGSVRYFIVAHFWHVLYP